VIDHAFVCTELNKVSLRSEDPLLHIGAITIKPAKSQRGSIAVALIQGLE
jgi:hypothetical protein